MPGLGLPRGTRLAAALLGFCLSVACAASDEGRTPREIATGVDVCGYCHMAVDDVERAAQWVPESGRVITFDEPGCLIAWLQRNPGVKGRAYVADGDSGEFVAAEGATYLAGATRTGMGFDIIAFAEQGRAAERLGTGEGEILGWSELNERGVRDAHAH